jgi:DNA-binding SARP family transcriptional activator
MVRYAILGPVELRDGGRVVVGGPRQVALLALLLVNANRALSNDRLIDTLWGDLGPAGALKRLQAAILRLRRVLDPEAVHDESVLRRVAGGYLLAVGPGELDAEVFQARVRDGRRALEAGEARRAREVLVKALGMWRGPALAEVAYEDFAQPEIRRLEELRLAALEVRVDCELQLGEHGEVIGELEALVAEHPGRERLAAQLMLALYRSGRQSEALEVYARTRAYLSGELGLEPGAALKALQRRILEQSGTLTAPGYVHAAAPRQPRRALPRPLQPAVGQLPFTGREQQLAYLVGSWADIDAGTRRVVVISGEAGIGKTRAAAELAARVHDEGSLVLYCRCDEGLAVPYQPFVEALRHLLRWSTLNTCAVSSEH